MRIRKLRTAITAALVAGVTSACTFDISTVESTSTPSPSPTSAPTPTSTPTPGPTNGLDNIAPVITSFSMPASSTSLDVSGLILTASDNVGITGFFLSERPASPASNATGWSSLAPTHYAFTGIAVEAPTAHTLYAWAKDAAGNISQPASATTTVAVPSPTSGSGKIIFQDNFNSSSDWFSKEAVGGSGDLAFGGSNSEAVTGAPLNWSSYGVGKRHWPASGPVFEISDLIKGGGDRCLAASYEISDSATGWAGGRLVKWLGQVGYDDIVIRFSEWYAPGYKMRTMFASFLHKMFRLESNVDNPKTADAAHDPTNMYHTPSTRPDWDNPFNNQPWGPWIATQNTQLTLATSLTATDTTVTVSNDISSLTSTGTLVINGEQIRYLAKTNTTRTFSSLIRGQGGTPFATAAAGTPLVQNSWNVGTPTNGGKGGKQAYVIFAYNVNGDHAGVGKLTFNPEGRAGSLSDMTTSFDGSQSLNWNDYFGERIDGQPGDFPWSAHNLDGYDYQGNGQWVTWDIHAKMNTIGQTDGFVKVYLTKNGVTNLVVQKTGFALRKNATTRFNLLALPDNMFNLVYASYAGRLVRTGSGSVSPTFTITKSTESVTLTLSNNGATEWSRTIASTGLTLADLLSGMPAAWTWDGGVTRWTQSQIPIESINTVTDNKADATQSRIGPYTYIPTINAPSGMPVSQQFAIDNVVVYTPHYLGTEPACNGQCTAGLLPPNYVISGVIDNPN